MPLIPSADSMARLGPTAQGTFLAIRASLECFASRRNLSDDGGEPRAERIPVG
jgi:hypothetical protein